MAWLFLIGIGVAVYFLLKDKKFKIGGISEAEETLKRRYVDGEIDEEEYLRKKKIRAN
jgi:uncharacterized membrane protein